MVEVVVSHENETDDYRFIEGKQNDKPISKVVRPYGLSLTIMDLVI